MAYTTVDKVAKELQTTISSSTTPSSDTVREWIAFAKAEIDSTTGYSFEPMQITNVYLDSNGSHQLWVDTRYRPLISVDTVQVNSGTDFSESWTTLTSGTQYYIADKVGGLIKFAPTVSILSLDKSIKIGTVTYGYEEVPPMVEALATKIVAMRYIRSQIANTNTTLTQAIQVGPIRVRNDSSQVVQYLQDLKSEIDDLYMKVGTLRAYLK